MRRVCALIPILLAGLLLAGCSSQKSVPSEGTFQVAMIPPKTRLFPIEAVDPAIQTGDIALRQLIARSRAITAQAQSAAKGFQEREEAALQVAGEAPYATPPEVAPEGFLPAEAPAAPVVSPGILAPGLVEPMPVPESLPKPSAPVFRVTAKSASGVAPAGPR